MAYIGKTPTVGNFQVCDAISVVNNQAAYTMKVATVNVSPESANHMIVSLNGVIQKPTDAYTVSNSVITFASNLVTGDVINFIQILGSVLNIGTVSDATVSTAKIVDNAVTLAKMASGTDGNIISYDASGNPVAVATGNDGQVLTSTGAGSPPAFETLPVGGITEADQWRLYASFNTTGSDLTSNLERNDTSFGLIGNGMSQSSGIFTFPSTGIYLVSFSAFFTGANGGDIRYAGGTIRATENNSSYSQIAEANNASQNYSSNYYMTSYMSTIFDVTNVSTHKVKFNVQAAASIQCTGASGTNKTTMTFIRLGA